MATKAELKTEQDKIMKSQQFDQSYFRDKSQFEDDGTENYLVFQPMYRYFVSICNTIYISSLESKGSSDEIIKHPNTSDSILAPALSYIGNKTGVKFDKVCLKQDKITFTHKKIQNKYISYEINFWNYIDSSDSTLN